MAELLVRQRKAVYALAEIEGDPIEGEPVPPDPAVIRDTLALFNNPNPQFDDIKLNLLGELERSLDGIERRMAVALKFRAAVRRQRFQVLSGGKS